MIEFLSQYGGYFYDFRQIVQLWEAVGIFDIVLPFILVFALVFAIFEKATLLGTNKGVHAVIALVISFFAVTNLEVTRFFTYVFQSAAVGLIVLLVFLLMIGLFMTREQAGGWMTVGSFIGVGVFAWAMSRAMEVSSFFDPISQWFVMNPLVYSLVVLGIPIAIVVAVIVYSGKEDSQKLELRAPR